MVTLTGEATKCGRSGQEERAISGPLLFSTTFAKPSALFFLPFHLVLQGFLQELFHAPVEIETTFSRFSQKSQS